MIHNVLMTGLTSLSKTDELRCWDNQPFLTVWPEPQPTSKGITKTIKKKAKRARTAFTTEHVRALEKTYCKNKYIDTERRRELAKILNISEKCIKVWFQNRRMKEKKESSESSCDSSSEIISSRTPTPSNVTQNNPVSNQYYPNDFYNDQYYQLPNSYPYNLNEVPITDYRSPFPNMLPNINDFPNDNFNYPTQYYPSNEMVQDVQANQNTQYSELHNYWTSYINSNNDVCYL